VNDSPLSCDLCTALGIAGGPFARRRDPWIIGILRSNLRHRWIDDRRTGRRFPLCRPEPYRTRAAGRDDRPRNYAAHAIIVSEGDRADTLFLILSGRVKVFVGGDDGRESC